MGEKEGEQKKKKIARNSGKGHGGTRTEIGKEGLEQGGDRAHGKEIGGR